MGEKSIAGRQFEITSQRRVRKEANKKNADSDIEYLIVVRFGKVRLLFVQWTCIIVRMVGGAHATEVQQQDTKKRAEVDASIYHYYRLTGLVAEGAPTAEGLKKLNI